MAPSPLNDVPDRPNGCHAALAAVAIIATVIFALTRTYSDVEQKLIPGRYRNRCCNDIIINRSSVEFGNRVAGYSARHAKWGTELTLTKPLGPFHLGGPTEESDVDSLILIEKDRKTYLHVEDDHGGDLTFEKVG